MALQPLGVAVQIRLAEQDLTSQDGERRSQAEQRLSFLRRHLGELVYDLRCRRGHSTACTMPQLVRAMRRTSGRWVTLPLPES